MVRIEAQLAQQHHPGAQIGVAGDVLLHLHHGGDAAVLAQMDGHFAAYLAAADDDDAFAELLLPAKYVHALKHMGLLHAGNGRHSGLGTHSHNDRVELHARNLARRWPRS